MSDELTEPLTDAALAELEYACRELPDNSSLVQTYEFAGIAHRHVPGLLSEVRRLRALEPYCYHSPECSAVKVYNLDRPCDCGYAEVRDAV